MFFESPHARYYFPPESVIREPSLEDFNYATMDLEKDIDLIRNRYVNSVHHLDSQFGRIFSYLRDNDLLGNTIVLVTGDHGEEFMENGHWGYGSTFSDAQTLVPMILWIPKTGASVTSHMTSHLDVIPTLLPLLGVKNPATDYSLGYNMLTAEGREFTIAAHWRTLGYIGKSYKASFAMDNAHFTGTQITKSDDTPVGGSSEFFATHQADLIQVMQNISQFTAK